MIGLGKKTNGTIHILRGGFFGPAIPHQKGMNCQKSGTASVDPVELFEMVAFLGNSGWRLLVRLPFGKERPHVSRFRLFAQDCLDLHHPSVWKECGYGTFTALAILAEKQPNKFARLRKLSPTFCPSIFRIRCKFIRSIYLAFLLCSTYTLVVLHRQWRPALV